MACCMRAEGDCWRIIEDPYAAFARGRDPRDEGDLSAAGGPRPLAPMEPLVLVGIAQNRGASDHPQAVQAWLKSSRTIVAHRETVRLRRDAGRTVAEAEIGVVIGRDTGDPTDPALSEANAHEFVLGVTPVNDISYPDRAELDPRNFESKGGDGSTPLGPWIDTQMSIDKGLLALEIDGTRVRDTSAEAMPKPVQEALAYVDTLGALGTGRCGDSGRATVESRSDARSDHHGDCGRCPPGDEAAVNLHRAWLAALTKRHESRRIPCLNTP